MARDVPFSARCTVCGNQSVAKPDRLSLEATMSCRVCGHTGTVLEFADIAVLEALLKEAPEGARLVH